MGTSSMTIEVVYEDEELLIINKPAGVTVNRAETTKDEITIQDWAETKVQSEKYKVKSEKRFKFGEEGWDPAADFHSRGGIVHRLDKETSGVLILAKTPTTFVHLQKQFHEREVKKVYIALAHGEITPKSGAINVPVGRLPWNRNRFGILPGGRESMTTYKVITNFHSAKGSSNEILSLVELYPQSGRTHQIRVHLKYINHPIFSDFLYAGRKTARADRKILPRVFLHATKISFTHPITNMSVTFEAPLPAELTACLKTFIPI